MPPKRKDQPMSCDWTKPPVRMVGKSARHATRLFTYKGNYLWRGVMTEQYKPGGDDWSRIVRKTLIGNRGESVKFHLRYFEIAPNGCSSYEVHKHEHVVIGIRGRGVCIAGKRQYSIGFLDTLYIKSGEPHQLKNTSRTPFGFFCIVNAKRDKPKIIRKRISPLY